MDALTGIIIAVGFAAVILLVAWAIAPKGWRTIVANSLAVASVYVSPLILHLMSIPWSEVYNAQTAFWIIQGLALLNLLLRLVTDTPVGERRKPRPFYGDAVRFDEESDGDGGE